MIASWIALVTITVTLIGIAAGRFPHLRMNRATIALVGATALVTVGAISLEEAYESLDLDTLLLLLAMMVINANLRIAGFFGVVADHFLPRARSPRQLLLLLMASSGILSALFLNDTIVLMFTPLVLEIVLALRRNPIPYLMGLATAANTGSVGAITGNPQNILIGTSSNIPFVVFSAYLMPVAVIGLGLAWGIIILVYRTEFSIPFETAAPTPKTRIYRPLLIKSTVSVLLLVVLLLAGVPVPFAALISASILLITRRLKPERVFREIDWSLLVFFAGLFVVTGAIVTSGWSSSLFSVLLPLAEGGIVPLTGVTVVLSNLISNVPAVLLFRPFVPRLPDPHQVWLVLAMATTLAGNLTLLGSVANLIVAETAHRYRINLTFTEYLKAGIPVTLITLAAGVVWLWITT